jgi:hypothetical protein
MRFLLVAKVNIPDHPYITREWGTETVASRDIPFLWGAGRSRGSERAY